VILQSHPSRAHNWVLIAAPGCLLALPSGDLARFDGLAARLAGADGFRAALEQLVAGGISAAPSFALVDGDSAVARVVLRGEASVEVTAIDPDAAELTISGAGMATWSERVLEGARSLRLRVPGSTWTVGLEPAGLLAHATATPAAPRAESSVQVEPAAVTAEAEVVRPTAEVPAAEQPVADEPVAEVTLAPKAESDPSAPDEPYDFLFGDTIYRTHSGAAIRIPNPDPERPGDHDGHTVMSEELGVAGHVPAVPEAPDPSATSDSSDSTDASDTTVIAPIAGHVPAVPLLMPPAPVPVPALQLERADGSRESLARPVLIGRAPAVPAATPSGSAPRLITILDDRDISRSHVRVSVEGDAVVVTDLASKNGTMVTLPGGSPRRLRGGEPTVVLPGTVIDLGGGVAFTVRED
jgi:hypothetical protein